MQEHIRVTCLTGLIYTSSTRWITDCIYGIVTLLTKYIMPKLTCVPVSFERDHVWQNTHFGPWLARASYGTPMWVQRLVHACLVTVVPLAVACYFGWSCYGETSLCLSHVHAHTVLLPTGVRNEFSTYRCERCPLNPLIVGGMMFLNISSNVKYTFISNKYYMI